MMVGPKKKREKKKGSHDANYDDSKYFTTQIFGFTGGVHDDDEIAGMQQQYMHASELQHVDL